MGIIETLFIWMTKLFHYFMNQWYILTSNLLTQYGVHSNEAIEEIEKIQKRATKRIIKLKHKPCKDRLIYLNLPTLKCRWLCGNMIAVFKIIHNIYDAKVSPQLILNKRANTIGNNCKLLNHIFYHDLQQHFILLVL